MLRVGYSPAMEPDPYRAPGAGQLAPEAPSSGGGGSASPWVRLCVSLACVAAAYSTRYLLLPIDGFEQLPEFRGAVNASVGALGITPFISAAIFVELVSLMRPTWRQSRVSGAESRVWDRASLSVGLALAAIQGVGVAYMLQGAVEFSFPKVYTFEVSIPLVAGALLAGASVHRLAAWGIERWGIGNGFGWLVLSGFVSELIERAEALRSADTPWLPQVGCSLALVILLSLVVTVVPRWESGQPSFSPAEGRLPLRGGRSPVFRMFTCGNVLGVGLAVALLFGWGVQHAQGLEVALIWPLGLLFAAAYQPAARVAGLRKAFKLNPVDAVSISRLRLGYTLLTLGLLSVLILASERFPEFSWWLLLLPITCVAIDVVQEVRALQAGLNTRIWWFQRVYAADAAVEALAKQEIPAFVRGVHFRCLSHTFGAFLPLALFVSASDAERALAVLRAAAKAEVVS